MDEKIKPFADALLSARPYDPGAYRENEAYIRYEAKMDIWEEVCRYIGEAVKEKFPASFDEKQWEEHLK